MNHYQKKSRNTSIRENHDSDYDESERDISKYFSDEDIKEIADESIKLATFYKS